MQRPVADIGQRGVLVAHEAVEGAAAQAQQLEAADADSALHHAALRYISTSAVARSGPAGANATLPAPMAAYGISVGGYLDAFGLRIGGQELLGQEPAIGFQVAVPLKFMVSRWMKFFIESVATRPVLSPVV